MGAILELAILFYLFFILNFAVILHLAAILDVVAVLDFAAIFYLPGGGSRADILGKVSYLQMFKKNIIFLNLAFKLRFSQIFVYQLKYKHLSTLEIYLLIHLVGFIFISFIII